MKIMMRSVSDAFTRWAEMANEQRALQGRIAKLLAKWKNRPVWEAFEVNFVFTMMNFVFTMMNFVLTMMKFVLYQGVA